MCKTRRVQRVGAVTITLLMSAASAHAQFPPDSLVNLKFFPSDIDTRELINNMRGFAFALGVRCQYCHVGEEGMPLAEFDFPSDEKPTKRTTREMLKMVQEINATHLADLPERREPNVAVECVTCHRGQARPIMIQQVLSQTTMEHGLDSAKAAYRGLREQFYGSDSYDFSESGLTRIARSLLEQRQLDQALGLLQLNEEFHPTSANLQYMIGEAFAARGDTTEAIARMERAIERDPAFAWAKQRLEQLKQP